MIAVRGIKKMNFRSKWFLKELLHRRNFLILFLLFLVGVVLRSRPFKIRESLVEAADPPAATITSFTVSNSAVGATGVTYTLQFTLNQEFAQGVNTFNFDLNRLPTKSTWEGGDQTSNMATATGTFSSFQYNDGGGWQDIDIGGAGYFHKEISSQGLLIWGLGYISDSDIHGTQTTIPSGAAIRLVVANVTNPSKAGAYAFSVESGLGPSSSIYWLLPNDSSNQYESLSRTHYIDIGTYCLRLKVRDPTGVTAIGKAEVGLHNSDWSVNFWGARTYADGDRSFYSDDFWYVGGSGQETCPTGIMTIEANPPYGVTTYSKAADKIATLPTDKDKYYATPINLSLIQVTGLLDNPVADSGQYNYVTYSNVSFRPSDFSPTGFKNTQSDADGVFRMGGLSEGTYIIEFQMPWGTGYEGITVPDQIQIQVSSSGQVKTVSGSSACNSYADACDLGIIAYKLATKTVTGTLKDSSGSAVTNGRVVAFKEMGMGWAQDDVDSNGVYSLTIGGGTWGVRPEPNYDPSNPPDWAYCGMGRFFTFADDETVETKNSANTSGQTDFTIKRTSITVSGRVLLPNGTPLTGQGGVEIRSKEGCGTFANLDGQTGRFSTSVSPGTYNVMVQVWNQDYSAPNIQAITVSTANYDVGDLTLIDKKDTISGRVWTDINGNNSYDSGEGVSSQRVEVFKMMKKFDEMSGPGGGPMGSMGGGDFVNATSGENGVYTMKVTPGTWMINVMADPGMMGGYSETQTNYIYTGAPVQVSVATSTNGNTYADNNFKVTAADATIKGKLVSSSGADVPGVWGFAFADTGTGPMMGPGMGAPINNGIFTLKVPAGTYNVGVDFPPETSGYTAADSTAATVAAGETASISVVVKPNNSRIKVNFVNSSGTAITTLSRAEIFADNGSGGHIFKMFYGSDLISGSTTLSVCEGTWGIGYFIDPAENNYMSEPISKDNKVTVTSANDASNPGVINVTLRAADSTISGTVTSPTGTALAGVWISTDNRKVSDFATGGPMFMMGNTTDASGNYSISVPAGKYMVQAFLPPSMGYINPGETEVTVSPTSPGTVNLQFGQSDASITGSVYLSGTKKGAFISAYSETGGYSETNAFSGDFTLNVTKNDTWYLKAMYETGTDFYQSSVYKVTMAGATSKSQDLTLTKASFTLPDAVSTTFDHTNAKKITLSNGFSLSIPANAIDPTSNASGNNITVSVSPTAQLSTQNKSTPIGIGYEIAATDDSGSLITSNFNDNVTITIPYTDAFLEAALGTVSESTLDNGYWDTTTSVWKGLTGATIDTTNNTISFTVNHFTTFSILATTNPNSVSTTVSSGVSSGTTSSGGVSKPMAPKDTGSIVEGAVNRVFLMIPSGALKWDADFGITKLEDGFKKPTPPLWIAGGPYQTKMKSWWNGAEFTDLNKPITLIVRYDPTALGEIPENSLRLNYYDQVQKRWRPISSLLITDRHEVAAVVEKIHGTYALIGGFGYRGVPQYAEHTVTAESESQEIGVTEELLPKGDLSEEIKHPTAYEQKPPAAAPVVEEKKSWFRRLIEKVIFWK